MNGVHDTRSPAGFFLRAPPAFLAGGLLLWGTVTQHLMLAVLMIGAIESRRWIRARWELHDDVLVRLWRFCLLLAVVPGIAEWIMYSPTRAGFEVVEWLPVTFLPLLLAQRYGVHDHVASRLFVWWRKSGAEPGAPIYGSRVNLEYPYGCLTLFSAASSFPGQSVYYVGASVLLAWAMLWNPWRRRVFPVYWIMVFWLIIAAGHLGQESLRRLHDYVENVVTGNHAARMHQNTTETRLGVVTKLQQSPAIRWRLKTHGSEAPRYLRNATFTSFDGSAWHAPSALSYGDAREDPATRGNWALDARRSNRQVYEVTLRGRSPPKEAFLSTPFTPIAIRSFPADQVSTNSFGVTRAINGPRFVDCRIQFHQTLHADARPHARDLNLSRDPELAEALRHIARQMGLSHHDPRRSVKTLQSHFVENFGYSRRLTISNGKGVNSPIIRFLNEERAGHCEYFATSTVLLLRAAGIPSRYVTGYFVNEYNRRSKEYPIRGIHAHAWAQAWVNGEWTIVETTPAGTGDGDYLSIWQPVFDGMADIPFACAKLARTKTGQIVSDLVVWAILPSALMFILLRNRRKGRKKLLCRVRTVCRDGGRGSDSEWISLEAALAPWIGDRPSGVALRTWWRSLRNRLPESLHPAIDDALALHYQLRFGSQGLSASQRMRLRALVSEARHQVRAAHKAARRNV